MSKNINYKTLYLDFLKDNEWLTEHIKQSLINTIKSEDEFISFRKLYTLNREIEENIIPLSTNRVKSETLNCYDKNYIRHILLYQIKNNLSNSEVAKKFKMSRNTLSKWKRLLDNGV